MVIAFVLAKVAPTKENTIVSNLCQINNITEAKLVYGKYDMIIKVEAKNANHLQRTLQEDIRKIPDIISTSTLLTATLT